MGQTTDNIMEELITTRAAQAKNNIELLPKLVSSHLLVNSFEQGMRQLLDDLKKMELIQIVKE